MRRMLVALALVVSLAGLAPGKTTPRHRLGYTDHQTTNDAIDRLDGVIPPTKSGGPVGSAIFCGQLVNGASSTVDYLGPSFADASSGGEGFAADAGGAICNGLDSTTEATADLPLFHDIDVYVTGMYCRAVTDAGATGSGTSGVTFDLRVNAAATTPALSCTVPATSGIDCYATVNTDANLIKIAANTPADVRATINAADDLSANDGWCRVFFTFP